MGGGSACSGVGAGHAGPLLFGVVQGGMSRDLRLECASALAELDLPGYAIGGVSVGEGPALMREVLDCTLEALPRDRPRYVMGIGPPEDLLDAVALGADLFDCVMPTRNARGACAFTRDGKVRLRNAAWTRSEEPLEGGCDCPCCARVSRGYLRRRRGDRGDARHAPQPEVLRAAHGGDSRGDRRGEIRGVPAGVPPPVS